MRRVAEQAVTLWPRRDRYWVRIHAPKLDARCQSWRCRVENPVWWDEPKRGSGATALQALSLSLARLSIELYATAQYDMGEPRAEGAANGDLGMPATEIYLDRAPYPFSRARVRGQARFAVVNDAGWDARLLAEETYAVAGSRRRLRARIYAPRLGADGRTWSCAVSATAPLGMRGQGLGRTSLQALVAGLALLSHHLYGSSLYKAGRLGWPADRHDGRGDHLLLPAVTEVLDVAHYPF